MMGRIVEIETDNRHLSVKRGFLVISDRGHEQGRVPLDDIAAVIANAHGITYSNNLLVSLAERNITFLCCSPNHRPAAILWPVVVHHKQAGRIDAQIAASKPTHKRLWKQIVQAKLLQQAAILDAVDKQGEIIRALVQKVRSGDPDNIEAQAARRYWQRLMGSAFRRDKDGEGINALLNYGYAILRAATARAVMAAGLHPALGIHHQNQGNPLRLVDDLMEPYRPLVDYVVYDLTRRGIDRVERESKTALASLMYRSIEAPSGRSPIIIGLHRVAQSLSDIYAGADQTLALPTTVVSTSIGALVNEELVEAC